MPRQTQAVPSLGDFLTDAQVEQFADLLARLLISASDTLARQGIDPYTLLDEAGLPRPPRGKERAS